MSPSRLHSASSSADTLRSRVKWTARSSSGWRVRAYWSARAVAMSSRSTSTITTWRLSTGASAASAAPSSSWRSSSMYWRWRRRRTSTPSGRMTRITQAPSVNLATAMITRTTAESTDAVPLMTSRRRQWSSLWVRWYLAMPAPAMVKPVNTPMA